jgi:hypothetical protein
MIYLDSSQRKRVLPRQILWKLRMMVLGGSGKHGTYQHYLRKQILLYTNYFYSVNGLSSVPACLINCRDGLGLVDPVWTSYGKEWRSLAALWLRAETALSKTGRCDLTITEINDSTIPNAIKDWMYSKRMAQDARPPDDRFGKVWTAFLASLKIDTYPDGDALLEEVWCRPGQTGIVLFILGLYWQAEYSGAGNDWQRNMELVKDIFTKILSAPKL